METKLCIILFPQSIFNTTAVKMGKRFPPKYVNLLNVYITLNDQLQLVFLAFVGNLRVHFNINLTGWNVLWHCRLFRFLLHWALFFGTIRFFSTGFRHFFAFFGQEFEYGKPAAVTCVLVFISSWKKCLSRLCQASNTK